MKFLMEGKSWPEPAPKDSTAELNSQLPAVSDSAKMIAFEAGLRKLSTKDSEVDPNGYKPQEPGAKLDAGKVDVLRGAINYFPNALTAVARVSELGARKYSWKGWETVSDGINRYGAALARHLLAEPFAVDDGRGGLGEGVLHAAQVAWNALARLELILKELDGQRSSNP